MISEIDTFNQGYYETQVCTDKEAYQSLHLEVFRVGGIAEDIPESTQPTFRKISFPKFQKSFQRLENLDGILQQKMYVCGTEHGRSYVLTSQRASF